jgi:hypothetical protein
MVGVDHEAFITPIPIFPPAYRQAGVKGEGGSGSWTLSQEELRLKARGFHHPRW